MEGSLATLVSFGVVVVLLAMAPVGQAQTNPGEFLAAHNAARAEVGVGPMEWDDAVASYAIGYANQRIGDCRMEHSRGSGYGENLFKGFGKEWSAGEAVADWVSESQWYDYNTNTCSAPSGESCGHYTQVVWRDSVRLGCARVKCNSGEIFITCNYSPQGNFNGGRPY